MGNKQKCDAHLALQIEHQIDNLRAYRHVQRRYRFIGNHHFWIERQRAGNTDALALAAGKLVRIAPGMFRLQSDAFQ